MFIMAITKPVAELLAREASIRSFKGSILSLGKPDVWLTQIQFLTLLDRHNLKIPSKINIVQSQFRQGSHYIDDITFFAGMGCSDYSTLDCCSFEGATHIHDLNSSDVPASLRDRFDLVINFGTLEHVFNTCEALAAIHKMLKVGGRAIHSAPVNNQVDHGYYSFSPSLLTDYYRINSWEIADSRLLKYRDVTMNDFIMSKRYPFDVALEGRLGISKYSSYLVVQKSENSSFHKVPTQEYYLHKWAGMTITGNEAWKKYFLFRVLKKFVKIVQSSKPISMIANSRDTFLICSGWQRIK
jgi:hypothetical protein